MQIVLISCNIQICIALVFWTLPVRFGRISTKLFIFLGYVSACVCVKVWNVHTKQVRRAPFSFVVSTCVDDCCVSGAECRDGQNNYGLDERCDDAGRRMTVCGSH